MNTVNLLGRLGKDAEIRETSTDNVMVVFSLATTKKWRDRNGEEQKKTQWHSCVYYVKSGKIADHLTKGREIAVVGELDYYTKENDDGTKTRFTNIKVDKIYFTSGGARSQNKEEVVDQDGGVGDDPLDDLPF